MVLDAIQASPCKVGIVLLPVVNNAESRRAGNLTTTPHHTHTLPHPIPQPLRALGPLWIGTRFIQFLPCNVPGPLECSLEFIARNFNLGHSGAQTAEESVKFRVTPACPTPGAEESGLSGIPPPPRVPGEAPKGGPPVRAQGASLHPRAWEKGRRNTPTEVPWNLEEAWYARTRRTSPGKPRGSRRSLRTVPSTPVRAVGEEKGFRIGGSPSVSRHRMSHMRTLACTFTHIHIHSGTVT